MKASLLLLPVSVLSAVALAACGSSSSNTTVTSGGRQINTAAKHRPGTTLYVGRWPGLHHTYRTIQAAVNAAHPGDRVLIAAGDYHESPNSGVGVRVTVPDVVIEGVDRNTVIVDGTKPGARSPCDPDPRFQNFGPALGRTSGMVRDGRNGIVVDHASGVTVENHGVQLRGDQPRGQVRQRALVRRRSGNRKNRPWALARRRRDGDVYLHSDGH